MQVGDLWEMLRLVGKVRFYIALNRRETHLPIVEIARRATQRDRMRRVIKVILTVMGQGIFGG